MTQTISQQQQQQQQTILKNTEAPGQPLFVHLLGDSLRRVWPQTCATGLVLEDSLSASPNLRSKKSRETLVALLARKALVVGIIKGVLTSKAKLSCAIMHGFMDSDRYMHASPCRNPVAQIWRAILPVLLPYTLIYYNLP